MSRAPKTPLQIPWSPVSRIFGTDSPFEPDSPIMGGGKKQVRTQAVTPGCYKYDAGAFRSGTIYGMSGASKAELVISP
jgi:hypothetical protein